MNFFPSSQKSRQILGALVCLLLFSLAGFWLSRRHASETSALSQPRPAPEAIPAKELSPSAATPSPATPSPATPPAPVASTGSSEPDPEVELDKVYRMIRDYHTLTGADPVGTNAEFMKAIMGGNPREAQLGPPEGQTLNEKGELLDPWGTPYFFHQMDKDHTEIWSAGPDKTLGTDDDVIKR